MSGLFQDLRSGLRMLTKNPSFSLLAVLTLALGIGANSAIFTLTYAVILKGLPVPNPGQLVRYTFRNGQQDLGLSGPVYDALRKHESVDEDILACSSTEFAVEDNGNTTRVSGVMVTSNGFRVLELRPFLGRVFGDADDVTGGGPNGYQAVVSYEYWKQHFSGTPAVLGRTLKVDERPVTVIGVLPPGFDGLVAGERADLVLPLSFEEVLNAPNPQRHLAGNFWLSVLGRLKPGETLKSAAANLRATDAIMREEADPSHLYLRGFFAPFQLGVESGRSGLSYLRVRYSRPLVALEVLVGLLLLLCCANTALLVLARLSTRFREFALRSALGAPRARLFRQTLIEVGLLAVCGLAAGVWFGWIAARSLVSMLSSIGESLVIDVSPRVEILAFAAFATAISVLAAGLVPAWRASSVDPMLDLKRGEALSSSKRLGAWIVPAQVAVSLTLLVAASLLGGTLFRLLLINSGLRAEGVVLADVDLSDAKLSPKEATRDVRQIVEALENTPGIQTATVLSAQPLTNGWSAAHFFSVGEHGAVHTDMRLWMEAISPGYFATMGTCILQGRALTRADDKDHVCVMSASAASYFFPGQSALGKLLYAGGEDPSKDGAHVDPKDSCRVVGIAEDARLLSLREPPPRAVYELLSPDDEWGARFGLAVRGISAEISAAALRNAVHGIVSAAVPPTVYTFDELVKAHLRRERMLMSLSISFAAIGLLLTALGLYGVLSRSVLLRTREIGLRLALGAVPHHAMKTVLVQAARLVLIGAGLGIAAALVVSRMLRSLLFGVAATSPVSILAAVSVLCLVAVLAAYIPARRATKVDPMEALRYE